MLPQSNLALNELDMDVRKPAFYICEQQEFGPSHGQPNNLHRRKQRHQLHSHCESDERLCFRIKDSTIPLLSESKISSLYPSSVTVQSGLCRIWSEPKLFCFVFSRTASFVFTQYDIRFINPHFYVKWPNLVLSVPKKVTQNTSFFPR